MAQIASDGTGSGSLLLVTNDLACDVDRACGFFDSRALSRFEGFSGNVRQVSIPAVTCVSGTNLCVIQYLASCGRTSNVKRY